MRTCLVRVTVSGESKEGTDIMVGSEKAAERIGREVRAALRRLMERSECGVVSVALHLAGEDCDHEVCT